MQKLLEFNEDGATETGQYERSNITPKDFDNWTEDAQEKWNKEQELACSDDDLVDRGDGGYGSGNSYGGDILQALAEIVGIVVESV